VLQVRTQEHTSWRKKISKYARFDRSKNMFGQSKDGFYKI